MTQKLTIYAIIILTFAIYGNSLFNKYSLDDHLVNYQNPLVKEGFSGIPEIFKTFSFQEKNLSYAYRPVLLSTFAMDHSLFGANPHSSHFISICLYILFSIMLFYFFNLLFPEKILLITVTILLFIVHPIHSEIVDNIKSRDELLAAVFGLGLLIQYIKFARDCQLYRLFMILSFFILGILSKPSIYYYVALLPFFHILKFPSFIEKKKWNILGYITLLLVVIVISTSYLKEIVLSTQFAGRKYFFYENPLVGVSLINRIPAALSISLYNLKLLIWPFVLSFYYGYNQVPNHSWNDYLPYLSLLLHLTLIFLFFKYFSENKFLLVALLFYLINSAIVSNLFILIPGIIAERFLFFASIGQTMIYAYIIIKIFEKLKWIRIENNFVRLNYKSGIALILILVVFSVKIYSRNKDWADEFTIIKSDVSHLINSAKANDLMAFHLMAKIRSEKNLSAREMITATAIKHCEQCLKIYRDHVTCWNNLGTIYFSKRDFHKAEICFRKAMSIDSTDANPIFNIATIFQLKNNPALAIKFYESALEHNPDIHELIPMYKLYIIKNQRIPDAIGFIRSLIDNKFKNNYNLHLLIIDFYNEEKDFKNMLVYLKKANAIKHNTEIANYIDKLSKIAS